MKLRVAQKDLVAASNRLGGTISEKALGYIALSAADGKLSMTSADKILSIYCNVACDVQTPGRVFVPSRLFADGVKQLDDCVVSMEVTGKTLLIKAQGALGNTYDMKLPVLEDIPWRDPQPIDATTQLVLPTGRLSYMLDQTQFCVAHESTRNYGTVAYLHRIGGDSIRMVGTDGYRLSYSEFATSLPANVLERGICLSKRSLEELARMSAEGFETLRLSVSNDGTTLLAEAPDYRLYTRLSSVEYPEYQGVLPGGTPMTVRVSRPLIQSVVRRALWASDKSLSVHLTFSEGDLLFSAQQSGSTELRENLPIEGFSGTSRRVSLNAKYVNDVFSNTRTEYVTIQIFPGKDDPIVICPVDEPGGVATAHVIVPITDNV